MVDCSDKYANFVVAMERRGIVDQKSVGCCFRHVGSESRFAAVRVCLDSFCLPSPQFFGDDDTESAVIVQF